MCQAGSIDKFCLAPGGGGGGGGGDGGGGGGDAPKAAAAVVEEEVEEAPPAVDSKSDVVMFTFYLAKYFVFHCTNK